MRHFLTLLLILLFFMDSCTDDMVDAVETSVSEKKFPELDTNNYNVAFLIMDGVFNTELTAPYDIFHHTIFRDSIKPMNVFTVANTDRAITSFEGLRLLPDFNYLSDSLPKIDVLVVPSAEHHLDTDLEDMAMLDFVRQTAANALFVTSHCDGAFVLAEAGLLDTVVCTTFPADIPAMRKRYPQIDVRDSTLFVHHGKFITSAGGARSFEAALYLCEFLYGKKNADEIAEGMVIGWNLADYPHTVISN